MLTLTPKQNVAWRDHLERPELRRHLFYGGARSGKTDVILTWLCVQAATYPGARILMARRTRIAAAKSLWSDSLVKMLRGRTDFKMLESDLEIRHSNGSLIRVDGFDDQERVDKILGTEYLHIFFNEATQISWPTVQTVLSRLAQVVPGAKSHKAIFDCNPKSQRHWLYKAGILHQHPETGEALLDADTWSALHWIPDDNPYLSTDFLETPRAMTGTQRRRMLEGVWREGEGAVYDEFDEDIHIHKGPMPAGWERWDKVRGIDFGYTNPFVCLWGAIDPDGRLWIYRERYIARQTVQVHAAAINAEMRRDEHYRWTVADHDAEDRATLHEAGIMTQRASKHVERGIKAVKERLKVQPDDRPRLIICEACTETISEFYDYAWQPQGDNRNAKEVPLKDRDHAMDPIRYMVMKLDQGRGGGLAIPGYLPIG